MSEGAKAGMRADAEGGVTGDAAGAPGPGGIAMDPAGPGASSVDTAHAVDRDFLDQKFLGGQRLGLVLVRGWRDDGVFEHEDLLRRGTGCHSNGAERRRSRLWPWPEPGNRPVTGRKMTTERPVVISGVVNDVSGGTGGLPG